MVSIFQECDKYDANGNEVENGDGIIQITELEKFLDKIEEFGFKFRAAMFDCYKEVQEKQKQEELEAKQERLNNPPKAYDPLGFGDDAISYIFEKLESLGIETWDVDFDVLTDVMARFDYDLDSDLNSIISKKEADSFYSTEYVNKYMNKDANGQSMDTHVLDWIINNYLSSTKPKMGL